MSKQVIVVANLDRLVPRLGSLLAGALKAAGKRVVVIEGES